MGSTRRQFTDEYRAAAVELVLQSGRTNADVARSLGIGPMALGKWVKKAREGESAGSDAPLNVSERAELEHLRKENAGLRMQAEFAKKVAAWFGGDEK